MILSLIYFTEIKLWACALKYFSSLITTMQEADGFAVFIPLHHNLTLAKRLPRFCIALMHNQQFSEQERYTHRYSIGL
jgi:hypothetical protein